MHILIVISKCDAVGSFPACVYPCVLSAREIAATRLAICRAAREIAATRLVICRADYLMNLWALTKDFRAHTNCY